MKWEHEQCPDWDRSGTVAESWYCQCGECDCRIDRFTTGEYAYSVSREGEYLPGAENQPADSFEDASLKCWTIAEKWLLDIAVLLYRKGYSFNQDTVADILAKLEWEE